MANFNENVSRGIGYILNSQEFFIYRAVTIKEFARMIHDELYLLTNTYRLFIQYKTTHRAKKMAGRCFLWDNSHGDHMADPGNGIELRSINDASQDDCEGFGNPRFDGMESAILIADRYVIMYGDVKVEADSIRKDKKHVICTVSLCGSIVSFFRIPAEVFDRHFGLEENFPKQYEKVFGKNEDAKPVQEENDLIMRRSCIMIEHRIVSESVLYDTVLPSGNLYTKRLMERIVKQFKEDEKFREGMLCVPQSKLKENHYLDYPDVAGKIVNLWIDESEQRLMAELLILDTPCGRLIEEAFRRCDTINVVPFGIADSIDVDGIHILSSDKYDLRHFEIVVVPYCGMRREER